MSESTPEYASPSKAIEAYIASQTGQRAAENLNGMVRNGVAIADANPSLRTFLSPLYPNAKFLVRAGKAVTVAPQSGMPLGMTPMLNREAGGGDLWVHFASGICATEDLEKIEWLEAHSGDATLHRLYHEERGQDPRGCGAPIGLCREKGPKVDDWFKMKLAQVPLAHRPAGLDADIDVDAYFDGVSPRRRSNDDVARGIEATIEATENARRERADGNRD